MKRISTSNITELKENEIFVFGSNLSGIHGAGAAKTALQWGAEFGKYSGLQGRTYAIPTKGQFAKRSLNIEEINGYIREFIEFCKQNSELKFLVTEIGCGLAGLKPENIAPLFMEAIEVENIYLPESFYNILTK
ncbi:MAG: hypothetical protein B6D44_09090 [Ignavibacteriales bacterium UTCHB2]|jgi:hypothetical protein|nr:hypothetical protein [Candidatus Nomurabacteria bacterium]OQY72829.1 MAG: hypothetical protein B6D44_09090 [Ignavibacteriales bacterium UTCHB2]